MRTKILVGLIILASAAVASCTSDRVAAPIDRSAMVPTAWTGGGTTCDPQLHPECAPCHATDPDCQAVVDGRMTGGGGQVQIGDVYITRGFTLHCDITLSNNLEINWPGNKWHLDKPITSALCIDDPDISPEPPRAPFDTFIGTAFGQLNGVDGSYIRFILVDAGEPGGANDRSAMQIFDANGTLVLDVPISFLTNGNLQAHEDQPHK